MMRFDPRRAGALALLALLIGPAAVLGQDAPVTVAGSGVVAPLFEMLAENAGVETAIQVTGTNAGLQALCSGDAQVALATRPISIEEEAGCTAEGIGFVELLAGHNVVAFVTAPDSPLPQCVTSTDLAAAFAPSAEGQANWSQVNPNFPDLALTAYGPTIDSAAYALADNIIEGVGLRTDLETLDTENLAEVLAGDEGAVAIVSLSQAREAGDAVRILDVDSLGGTGCATPGAENVENRTYPAAESLFIYAAADSVQNESLAAILAALTGEDGPALVESAGFTAASGTAYTTSRNALTDGTTGRLFTQSVSDFTVPDLLSGAISIAGSPILVQYFQDLTAEFTAQYPAVTTQVAFIGSAAGVASLCSGAADIVVTNSSDAGLLAACEEDIPVETVALGSEAVVLLASADAEYLTCLTSDQLAAVWQTSDGDPLATWDQVSPEFDAAPVYLFAPQNGVSSAADLLMIQTIGTARPLRADITERNNSPLYRAAAVANAGSGLTFLSWPQYQTVLNSGQEGIQLVAVDSGNGCVEPSVETITDGSYALARPIHLLISQAALARPEVQALLWTTLSDENYGLLQLADLVGIEFGDLPGLRGDLQTRFDIAMEIAATAQPEPEAGEVTETPAEGTEETADESAEADASDEAEATEDAG